MKSGKVKIKYWENGIPPWGWRFLLGLFLFFFSNFLIAGDTALVLLQTINGNIAPKSVSVTGRWVTAQNMMYRHSVTVYDEDLRLVKTIPDSVRLSAFGYEEFEGTFAGAPVEGAGMHFREAVYVSNYQMYGKGFSNPGHDRCKTSSDYDPGFVYRILLPEGKVDQVIQVGCVPKFVLVSPDDRYVFVSNWCSGDLSVISTADGKVVRTVPVGKWPRGLAYDAASQTLYVALMGEARLAQVDCRSFQVSYTGFVGRAPRHLVLSAQDNKLYISLNEDHRLAVYDPCSGTVVERIRTGKQPRSMVQDPEGRFLYVVNYASNSLSKVRAKDLAVIQTVPTQPKPVGLAYHARSGKILVACYSGCIQVFGNQVRAEKPVETPPVSEIAGPVSRQETGDLTLVVGSFQSEANARSFQKQLLQKHRLETRIETGSGKFRVCYGRYEQQEEVVRGIQRLQSSFGISSWKLNLKK